MVLIFWVSYAVRAINTTTPITAITKSAIELFIKRLMIHAITIPKSPKSARVPIPVRSRFV